MCEGGAEEGKKEAGKGERRRGGQKPKQRSVNRASVEYQRSLIDCWLDFKHTVQFCLHTYANISFGMHLTAKKTKQNNGRQVGNKQKNKE